MSTYQQIYNNLISGIKDLVEKAKEELKELEGSQPKGLNPKEATLT